jgi:phenylalanine-4-hydroxylase
LILLQRLYWFTIEFGLIQENGSKIYGAGIVSSYGETLSSLEETSVKYKFELETVLQMSFNTSKIQECYFEIESLEELFQSIVVLSEKWKDYELVH